MAVEGLVRPTADTSARRVSLLCARVGKGELEPAAALAEVTAAELGRLLGGGLVTGEDALARGRTRSPGVAVGVLAMSTEVAAELDRAGVAFVLAVDDADPTYFPALAACAGYFTADPGGDAFGPSRAVAGGRPTVIAVPYRRTVCEQIAAVRAIETPDGRRIDLRVPATRTAIFGDTAVAEGEWISLDAVTGALHAGRAGVEYSPVAEFYRLAWDLVEEAVAYGLTATHVDAVRSFPSLPTREPVTARLTALAADPVLTGYWLMLAEAHRRRRLDVWTTAHTPEAVGRAVLLTSPVHVHHDAWVSFDVPAVQVGLVRDERMWTDEIDLDILRSLVLGPDLVPEDRWRDVVEDYLLRHTARLTRTLAEARGGVVVLRALCLSCTGLLPAEDDIDRLAERCRVPAEHLREVVADVISAGETQGCRGARLLSQRPDLARLWLTAVCRAVRAVADSGEPARLRILLPTVTVPEEARRFLAELDAVAPEILGRAGLTLLDGVSVVIETMGAHLLAGDFLALRSEVTAVDGAMIGGADFTAACFTVDPRDAARTVFPGYLRAGILPASPFDTLDPLVGRAVLDLLDRTGEATPLMGLGGELAGSWDAVAWLAEQAAPRGLHYVTTDPDTAPSALFAAAGAGRPTTPRLRAIRSADS